NTVAFLIGETGVIGTICNRFTVEYFFVVSRYRCQYSTCKTNIEITVVLFFQKDRPLCIGDINFNSHLGGTFLKDKSYFLSAFISAVIQIIECTRLFASASCSVEYSVTVYIFPAFFCEVLSGFVEVICIGLNIKVVILFK